MPQATAEWTVARVKDELPDVPVRRIGGATVIARLTGRLNRFATLTMPGQGGCWVTFEVAWETVVSCLNRSRPVTS